MDAGQVVAEGLERRDGLVHAAHVELFLKILLGPLDVAANLVELGLALGFGLRVLIRVVSTYSSTASLKCSASISWRRTSSSAEIA